MARTGQRDDFRRHIKGFFETKKKQNIVFRLTKVLISPLNTMVFAIRLGSRGSLRRTRKTRAFEPPKSILGPVFASQNIVKHVSFVNHEAENAIFYTMLLDSKGSVFPFFVWKIYVFYGLFEALFGSLENDVFYAHLEPLLGFREKRVFGEKPSFAKAVYFTVFPLWTPFRNLIFLLLQNCGQK